MNCMNCGKYLKADAEVCDNCGAEVVDDTILDTRLLPRTMALSVMKSPLYFALAASWLVCFLLCVVCVFRYHSTAADFMTSKGFDSLGLLMLYIGVGAPLLLNGIGFLLSAKNAKEGKREGIDMVKKGVQVSFGFFAVCAATLYLGLFTLLLRVVFFDSYSIFGVNMLDAGEITVEIVFWMSAVVIVALSGFNFVFYKRLIQSIDTVKIAIENNRCTQKTSSFAAAMCFFWTAAPLFAAISLMNGESEGVGLLALFLIFCSVSLLLLGITVVSFRKIEIYSEPKPKIKPTFIDDNSMPISISKSATIRYCNYCGRILENSENCICGGKKSEERVEEKPASRLIYSGTKSKIDAETSLPDLSVEEKTVNNDLAEENDITSEGYFFRQDEL